MPAFRPVRRTQLISTYGVGSMVDLPRDESLMVAGLDVWPFARNPVPQDWFVPEERLAARLRVRELRLPPDFREGSGSQNPFQKIPTVRFPRWHYCPRCGDMEYVPLLEATRRRCPGNSAETVCASRPRNRRPFMIPVRLVAACPEGHIQDFPFRAWAHGRATGTDHRLRYEALGSSAALSGILIRCIDCKQYRTLAGSFEYDQDSGGPLSRIGEKCRGDRPWLGESDCDDDRCGDHLRVVQRGASNVYFPHTISSIYLPLWAEGSTPDVIAVLEDQFYWEILTDGLVDGAHIDPARVGRVATRTGVDREALLEAAQRRLDGSPGTPAGGGEEEYRRAEYNAFIGGRGHEGSDLFVDVIEGGDYGSSLSGFVRRVCLIRKLRETRALTGFTRILPAQSDNDMRLQSLSRRRTRWLPAVVVRGEGIFFEFDHNRITEWLSASPEVVRRAQELNAAYNSKRKERGQETRNISPKFLLLHTFAHVLMKQLSFDCGYGSAALRERLYCEAAADAESMQGLLIYTASGDAEGTLGGLVRQGTPGRLEPIVVEAVRSASWCSSDPVCIESPGQGTENANLAACHGCALLSETSCEEGNRLLDRGMIVGTIKDRSIGFLAGLLLAPAN
jgi:hypothetical protein